MIPSRKPGEGIIRLAGSAIVRPTESQVLSSLSPAAIELVTGVRMGFSGVLESSSAPSDQTPSPRSLPQVTLPHDPSNDWWGE